MRRTARLIATLALAALAPAGTRAGTSRRIPGCSAPGPAGFPAPQHPQRAGVPGQPVVIFTRDIVMRAVITDQLYTQRLVETARVTPDGVEFRFSRSLPAAPAGPFGLSPGGGTRSASAASPDPARAAPHRERDQLPRLH